MFKNNLLKIISALLIFGLLFHLPLSLADEISPTLTPTPSVTTTDNDNIATSESVLTQSHTTEQQDESTSQIQTGDSQSSDSTVLNSADVSLVESTLSEQNSSTIENNNNIAVDRNIVENNITGQNTATDNISLGQGAQTIIDTGNALSTNTIDTVVNANLLASSAYFLLENQTDQSADLDLTYIEPCKVTGNISVPDSFNGANTGNSLSIVEKSDLNTNLRLTNDNQATINNSLSYNSITGQNDATGNIGVTTINTGDASVTVNTSTLANTNLIGNCWFFGVVNLFGNQYGDVLLPYEQSIIRSQIAPLIFPQNTYLSTGNNSTINSEQNRDNLVIVNNTNYANTASNIMTTTNTGNNRLDDTVAFNFSPSIVTGNSYSQTHQHAQLNTNVFGNSFLILQINRFGSWTGNLIGPDGSIIQPDDIGRFSIGNPQIAESTSSALFSNAGSNLTLEQIANYKSVTLVNNINHADVDEELNILANSGNNIASRFNASINTGNATALANSYQMLNTNVVGDNWFYATINIFGDFVGNIVFPRPDLVLGKLVDRATARRGDLLTYKLNYKNTGSLWAKEVVVVDTVSESLKIVSASDNATIDGQTVTWSLGKIASGQSGAVYLTVEVKSTTKVSEIVNSARIKTSTEEINLINNLAENTISLTENPIYSITTTQLASFPSSTGEITTTAAATTNTSEKSKILGTTDNAEKVWFGDVADQVENTEGRVDINKKIIDFIKSLLSNINKLIKHIHSQTIKFDHFISQTVLEKISQTIFVTVPQYILKS